MSTYATAHPREDSAESFAHYLHIRDTLQTAAANGMRVRGPAATATSLVAEPREDPKGFAEIVDTWPPLTYALNAVNRSMGKDDLYPFVLSEAVLAKLEFVHDLVTIDPDRSELSVPGEIIRTCDRTRRAGRWTRRAEVAAMPARLGALADDPAPGADADRIDRIAAFEQMRGALAAAQQAEMVAFARSQVEAQIVDDRLDPAAVGRRIGDQIGLACRVSPFHGSRRLGIARALHFDLPGVRDLLAAGRISEDTAATVVSETRHLDIEHRRLVDKQICAAGIEQLSARRAEAVARRLGLRGRSAPRTWRGAAPRGRDRRVGLRPAPDTMSAAQRPSCRSSREWRAWPRCAGTPTRSVATGDTRTRDQIMADTLVERAHRTSPRR